MKRFFFILSLLVTGMISCQKEASWSNRARRESETFHVSFTVDGVKKNYTGYTFAHTESIMGFTEISILGTNTTTSIDNYITLYVDNFPGAKPISTGEYQDISTEYSVLANYTVNSVEYLAGQSLAEDAAFNGISLANHLKVKITSQNTQEIKGTFSGDFYKDGNIHSDKITITAGDFYVRFQ